MFCDKCGREIPDSVKFCRYCGNNTEGNGSKNESSGDSTGDHLIHKGEHKVKKHKRLLIIMIAIVVLALVAALIYLGSRYMMGGEATQEKAIAKSIEALADGDFDAWEKAANKDFMNYLYTIDDEDYRNEIEDSVLDGEWITEEIILMNVKKIDDVYIGNEDALFDDDDLNDLNSDVQDPNLKMDEFNMCSDVYVTYTDTGGNQSSTEYDYYYDEDEETEYECEIYTYKIKGRWYARIIWHYWL